MSPILRIGWPLALGFIAACGYVTGTTIDASVQTAFYGTDPALLPALVQLEAHTVHRSYLYVGGISATPALPQVFDPVGLEGGDSLTATFSLQTAQGVELARVVIGFPIQSQWAYGLGFQAGGVDASPIGACHQPPAKVAVPGFPGDTLFLWSSAAPQGVVC